MKKKNILKVSLISILGVCLIGCGNSSSTNPSTTTAAPTTVTPTTNTPTTNTPTTNTPTTTVAPTTEAPTTTVAPTTTPVEYQDVTKILAVKDLENQTVGADGISLDGFVINPGNVIDTAGSKTIDGVPAPKRLKTGSGSGSNYTTKSIKVILDGDGTIEFYAMASSSSAVVAVHLIQSDGTVIATQEKIQTSGNALTKYTFSGVTKGQYALISVGTGGANFYQVSTTCSVEKGVENGFEVNHSQAKKEYAKGEVFSTAGLQVYATMSNGAKELLSEGYSVDSSAYNKDLPGKYTIRVNYKSYTQITYEVEVFDITGVSVYLDETVNTILVGGSFNQANLIVKANLTNGSQIKLDSSSYTVSGTVNTAAAGEYQLSVQYEQYTAETFPVYVLQPLTPVENQVTITVDPVATTIGDATAMKVKTVTSAMQYLSALGLDAAVVKNVNLEEGTYFEKVTINVPNIHLVGKGRTTTKIEYNDCSDSVSASGSVRGTQGSASVAVKAAAEGLVVEKVGFINSYDYFAGTEGNKQAVALVCEADKATFVDCYFTSFQDTLYAKYGRQSYINCLIEGAIDYIFGNNAPAYFYNCEIKTLDRKDDKNNGYITANKGISSGNDLVTYGYVFDQCNLTAEEGVDEGTVSLGRPWGKDATVAFVNCNMGAHISKLGYSADNVKNSRYEAMSGNVPTNAHYVEYNNTGAGSINETVLGMKMLTAEEYANYTVENILGTTNGQVTYVGTYDISSYLN